MTQARRCHVANNEEFVNDQTKFKYIAVYNWGKYQERIKGMDVRRPFIRDAVSKDSDPDYMKLSCLQRYVLDGCRRLVALHGHNLPNDPTWVSRALCVAYRERSHVAHAVNRLVTDGLLLLTNQRDPFSKELNRSESKETNETSSSTSSSRQEDTDQNQPPPIAKHQLSSRCTRPAESLLYNNFHRDSTFWPQFHNFVGGRDFS